LWDIINKGANYYHEDRNTLAAILWVVPPKMQTSLVVKDLVKEAWEAIHNMRVAVDKVKEANTERVLLTFRMKLRKSTELSM
jgi:hypothetical protein